MRDRPETMAGRWAAKEAVSKVLGLGVRGIGWRDIEVERLPTGQPAVRLHGRAAARAEQLGMGRIAVSISHESDYAVAIAFGVRTAGGRFVFPPDIEERLDDRERRILARIERLRQTAEAGGADDLASDARGSAGRRCLSAAARLRSARGRRRARRRPGSAMTPRPASGRGPKARHASTTTSPRPCCRPARRAATRARSASCSSIAGSLDYAGAALLVCRAAGRAGVGLVTPGRAGVAPAAVRGQGRRGDDDGPARGRRRGGRPRAGARPDPRPRARRDRHRAGAAPGPGDRRARAHAAGPARRATRRRSCSTPRRCARWPRSTSWWEGDRRPAVLTPHVGEFRASAPGAASDPEADGDLADDDEARVAATAAAAAAWRPGRRPQGRADRRRRARTASAGRGAVREPGPRQRRDRRRPGRHDRGAARPGPRARSTRPGSASTCTGRRGTPCASASATPACSPPTCPTAWPSPASAWPRSPNAAGRAPGWGSGRRCGVGPERPGANDADQRAAELDDRADRGAAGGRRPAAAAPERLAGARPGRPGRQPGATCGRWSRAGIPVYPVVKADAYGHGAVPIARALEAAGADGLCVAALDEALALRRGEASRCRSACSTRSRPRAAPLAARARVAVAAGDAATLARMLDGAGRARSGPRPCCDLELEVETGLGRGGVGGDDAVGAWPGPSPPRRPRGWPACGPTCRPPRTATDHGRAAERFDGGRRGPARPPGSARPVRHVAASGGLLTDVAALDGVRPGPGDLRHRPRRVRRRRALDPVRIGTVPAGHVPPGPAGPGRRPARRTRRQLRPDVHRRPARAGSRRCRSATATGTAVATRTTPRRSSAAGACRSSATWRWTPSWSTSRTCPDRRSPSTTSSCSWAPGRRRDPRRGAGATAHHEQLGGRDPDGRPLPRVYHAASAPVGLRTLTQRSG